MSASSSASNQFIMKKFINKPENIVRELLDGLVKSHPDLIQLVGNDLVIRRKPKAKGKVWIVFGQGIGHEPAYDAMVGHGMHDVEVPAVSSPAPAATGSTRGSSSRGRRAARLRCSSSSPTTRAT